jgi:hypothetical protein
MNQHPMPGDTSLIHRRAKDDHDASILTIFEVGGEATRLLSPFTEQLPRLSTAHSPRLCKDSMLLNGAKKSYTICIMNNNM